MRKGCYNCQQWDPNTPYDELPENSIRLGECELLKNSLETSCSTSPPGIPAEVDYIFTPSIFCCPGHKYDMHEIVVKDLLEWDTQLGSLSKQIRDLPSGRGSKTKMLSLLNDVRTVILKKIK
jgi:hypothetical protein